MVYSFIEVDGSRMRWLKVVDSLVDLWNYVGGGVGRRDWIWRGVEIRLESKSGERGDSGSILDLYGFDSVVCFFRSKDGYLYNRVIMEICFRIIFI